MPTIEEAMSKIERLEARLSQLPASPGLPSDPPDPLPVGADGRAIETQPSGGAQPQPVYTWSQLQQAVQDNRITEDVAHQIWTDQTMRLAVDQAKSEITSELAATSSASRVEAEIAKYREAIPEIMNPASEQRQRVVREFARLTGELGYDKSDLRTELVAVQAAFGPITTVVKALKLKPEGHRDVSGDDADPGQADDGKDTDSGNTPPSTLSADEKRYYEDAIRNKVYKDWGAVRAELKFANSRIRRRYGARV